jgi:hypothetical protein
MVEAIVIEFSRHTSVLPCVRHCHISVLRHRQWRMPQLHTSIGIGHWRGSCGYALLRKSRLFVEVKLFR